MPAGNAESQLGPLVRLLPAVVAAILIGPLAARPICARFGVEEAAPFIILTAVIAGGSAFLVVGMIIERLSCRRRRVSVRDKPRHVGRRTRTVAVATALILGAYIAQTLQRPFGLQGDDDTLLFLLFSVAVMVAIYAVIVAAATARQRSKAPD